jgi:hypothetical protein
VTVAGDRRFDGYFLEAGAPFLAKNTAGMGGTKHPDEQSGTRLVQTFSDGGSSRKARRAARSSWTVKWLRRRATDRA